MTHDFHALEIAEVRRETRTAMSFGLTIPDPLADTFRAFEQLRAPRSDRQQLDVASRFAMGEHGGHVPSSDCATSVISELICGGM